MELLSTYRVLYEVPSIKAIDLVDQPRQFGSVSQWTENLFRRVGDCIRDTASEDPAESTFQRGIKLWAVNRCNQILRILNNNWQNNSIQGVNILRVQEVCWSRVATRLYGIRLMSQACGVGNYISRDCVYVTP